ncbi:MAG: type II toxin-antitoxin system RelE/ParE family toxin [Planctomycetaceae bacterium]
MTHRIEKTLRAETDAIEIWLYIAGDNPTAASDLIYDIERRLRSLAAMPESAEAVPEFGRNIRRSSVGNYVIYYRPIADGIQVIRILHGNRQPEDLV